MKKFAGYLSIHPPTVIAILFLASTVLSTVGCNPQSAKGESEAESSRVTMIDPAYASTSYFRTFDSLGVIAWDERLLVSGAQHKSLSRSPAEAQRLTDFMESISCKPISTAQKSKFDGLDLYGWVQITKDAVVVEEWKFGKFYLSDIHGNLCAITDSGREQIEEGLGRLWLHGI